MTFYSNCTTDDGSNHNNNNNNKSKIAIFASSLASKTKKESKKALEATKSRLSLEGQLKQARISLQKYVNPKIFKKSVTEDTVIPKWVLKRAKGIVFLTVIKAGFLFAANIGTGCVIVRKKDGTWTGPSSIGVAGLLFLYCFSDNKRIRFCIKTIGISFGFLVGASKVDYIMILPNASAVQQFTGKGQLRLGGEMQLALGPIGRDANGSIGAGDAGVSVIYSYSHAQGIYGGISLDSKLIVVRSEANKDFYDTHKISCADILRGNVECPANEDYEMIVHLLDSYCLDDDIAIPVRGESVSVSDLNDAYVPPVLESESKEGDGSFSVDFQRHFGKVADNISLGFGQLKKCISDVSDKGMAEVQDADMNNEETVGL